ncbi:MAG: hypothetical protein AAF328_00360 [Planctomycetota bacterium]
MPKVQDRKFTLTAAIQQSIPPGFRRELQAIREGFKQLVTGMNQADGSASTLGRSLRQVQASARLAGTGVRAVGTVAGAVTAPIRFAVRAIFNLKAALTAVALLVIGGRLAQALRATVASLDDIAKRGQRLGIAADELAALSVAGELAGIEFNTLATAAQRATRRISEFVRTGRGSAAGVLRELNLQLTDARGNIRSFADLLPDLAEAFGKVESPADRLRIAFGLFDSEGAALVQLLNQGGDALARTLREAEALAPALTNAETFRVAERLSDALTKASFAARGLAAGLIEVAGPRVVSALERVAPMIARVGETLAGVLSAAIQAFDGDQELNRRLRSNLAQAAAGVVDAAVALGEAFAQTLVFTIGETLRRLGPVLLNVVQQSIALPILNAVGGALADGQDALADLFAKIAPDSAIVADLRTLAENTREGIVGAEEQVGSLGEAIREALAVDDGAFDGIEQRFGFFVELRERLQDGFGAVSGAFADIAEAGSEAIQKARGDAEAVRETVEDIGDAADDARERLDSLADGLRAARSGFDQQVAASASAEQAGRRFGTRVADSIGGLGDALADVVSRTKSAGEAFRQFAASVLSDLGRMLIKFAAFRAVAGIFGFGPASGLGAQLVQSLNSGGIVRANAGTLIPGRGPDIDSVPALLTRGEYVNRRRAVDHYGPAVFEALNRLALPKSMFAGLGVSTVAMAGQAFFNRGGEVGGGGGGMGGGMPAVIATRTGDNQRQIQREAQMLAPYIAEIIGANPAMRNQVTQPA